MILISYLFRYFFVTFHLQYFKLIFRFFIVISHNFGLQVMMRSFFKPLFGFPGITSRINGVVIRTFVIVLSVLFLLIFLIVSICIYAGIVILPFYLLFNKFLYFLIFLFLVLGFKSFTYFKYPIQQIRDIDNNKDYFLSGGKKLRKIMTLIDIGNFKSTLALLERDRYIRPYIMRLELKSEDLFTFLNLKIDDLESAQVMDRIVDLNRTIRFKNIKSELILAAFILEVDKDEQFLYKNNLDSEMILGSLSYIKKIYEREPLIWEEDYQIPPSGGIDKGWASSYTGTLNKFSQDMTKLALKGQMPKLIGRESEREQVISILSKSARNNVLVLGNAGTGKTSFVKGLSREIALGTNIPSLKYKRLVSIDIGMLTSGDTGVINDNLSKIISEIKSAGNIILFIDEIHNFSSTLSSDPNAASVFSTLEPHLSNGDFQVIGTTSRDNYYKYISPNESFARVFDLVEMKETNKEDTLKIMALTTKNDEQKTKTILSYPAAVKSYELTGKYIHERSYPSKAISLVSQAFTQEIKADYKVITANDISSLLSKTMDIPTEAINDDEKEILLNLESNMHKLVVGQDIAIKSISDALKRGRLGVRNEDKPIASFLFAGPTGVGKTETAKAIAKLYFGDEKYMIRIDMSEYQSDTGVERLIGLNNKPGILTSKVREKPFSLILLDEIEKASKGVLNLFLQVLDDGRLSNTEGLLIDFSNTMIIMTTNVGTREVISSLYSDDSNHDTSSVALASLKEHFTPEFLNRFTGLIPYKPLSQDEIKQITRIKLGKVKENMLNKRITLDFSDEVISEIAEKGYSQEWGARPLNRVIEQYVETHLANLLLQDKIKPGSHYRLSQLPLE